MDDLIPLSYTPSVSSICIFHFFFVFYYDFGLCTLFVVDGGDVNQLVQHVTEPRWLAFLPGHDNVAIKCSPRLLGFILDSSRRLLANGGGVIDIAAATPATRLGAAGGRFQQDMDSVSQVELRLERDTVQPMNWSTARQGVRADGSGAGLQRELELNLGEGRHGPSEPMRLPGGWRCLPLRDVVNSRLAACLLESVQTGTAELPNSKRQKHALSLARQRLVCCAACCAKQPKASIKGAGVVGHDPSGKQ
jgi:hypothetical protein